MKKQKKNKEIRLTVTNDNKIKRIVAREVEETYNYVCQKSAQTIVGIKYKKGMKTIYSPFAKEIIPFKPENLLRIKVKKHGH